MVFLSIHCPPYQPSVIEFIDELEEGSDSEREPVDLTHEIEAFVMSKDNQRK